MPLLWGTLAGSVLGVVGVVLLFDGARVELSGARRAADRIDGNLGLVPSIVNILTGASCPAPTTTVVVFSRRRRSSSSSPLSQSPSLSLLSRSPYVPPSLHSSLLACIARGPGQAWCPLILAEASLSLPPSLCHPLPPCFCPYSIVHSRRRDSTTTAPLIVCIVCLPTVPHPRPSGESPLASRPVETCPDRLVVCEWRCRRLRGALCGVCSSRAVANSSRRYCLLATYQCNITYFTASSCKHAERLAHHISLHLSLGRSGEGLHR